MRRSGVGRSRVIERLAAYNAPDIGLARLFDAGDKYKFVRQLVLVLSATVLVLERITKTQPTFDHERLDVYRLSIEYVAFSYHLAKGLAGMNRPARDQWLRAAQSIPLNIAEGNGNQSLKDKNRFFEIARGSALECASIHDVLRVYDAIDEPSTSRGKSDLKRIVSMLTRLIQRKQTVAEDAIEYEYEYRDAEYEYEGHRSEKA